MAIVILTTLFGIFFGFAFTSQILINIGMYSFLPSVVMLLFASKMDFPLPQKAIKQCA